MRIWCDIAPDSWLTLIQMVQSQYFSLGIYGATQPMSYEGTMQSGMMKPPVILPQAMQDMVPTQVLYSVNVGLSDCATW